MTGFLAEGVDDQTSSQSLHVHAAALVKFESAMAIGFLGEGASGQT